MSTSLYFLFLGSWLFTSLVVDIVAIPAVFRNVSKIAEAGTVGMVVFGKYNYLELFFGLATFISHFFQRGKAFFKLIMGVLTILLINAISFTFFITPRITKINTDLYSDDVGEHAKLVLQNAHDYWHQFYVSAEKIKVVVLLILIIFSLYSFHKNKKDTL